MASLEDYLRNFAKTGSGFAFPSERCIVIESFASTSSPGDREYVPPANGFCVIWLEGTGVDAEIRKSGGAQSLSSNSTFDGAAQNIKAHIRFYPYVGS